MKNNDLQALRRECHRAFVKLIEHRDRPCYYWGNCLGQLVAHVKEEERLRIEAYTLRNKLESLRDF